MEVSLKNLAWQSLVYSRLNSNFTDLTAIIELTAIGCRLPLES
jgi:hypothetical protein